ncbi:Nickel/cobalt transporter regulator [compost metagenome]|jgi:Ni/Co efflux regulator RcnB|uniref:RcnB family protein n=1 Tax=Acinetobacter TaxID=469 RepID=UPI000FAFDCF0|nr:RcnB family protein [Acinetobacter sp.]
MKKILTILAISFSALMANSVTTAAPHDNDRDWDQPRHQSDNRGRDFRDNDDDERMQDKRRVREERGVKRLQQHKWQTGYVMPQHYRGNGYKVDYKEHDLPKPSRNQQWYKINNDYILVDTDSNNIVRIQGF